MLTQLTLYSLPVSSSEISSSLSELAPPSSSSSTSLACRSSLAFNTASTILGISDSVRFRWVARRLGRLGGGSLVSAESLRVAVLPLFLLGVAVLRLFLLCVDRVPDSGLLLPRRDSGLFFLPRPGVLLSLSLRSFLPFLLAG